MPLALQSADRLSRLIQDIHGRNPFYTRKLDAAGVRPGALRFPADLAALPLTTRGSPAYAGCCELMCAHPQVVRRGGAGRPRWIGASRLPPLDSRPV